MGRCIKLEIAILNSEVLCNVEMSGVKTYLKIRSGVGG